MLLGNKKFSDIILGMKTLLIIILLLGGIALISAEKSLPGEKLYYLKTNVSEKAISLFTQGKRGTAERNITLMERRFKEANMLIEKNRLTQENSTYLLSQITAGEEKILDIIDALQKEDEDSFVAEDINRAIDELMDKNAATLQRLYEAKEGAVL